MSACPCHHSSAKTPALQVEGTDVEGYEHLFRVKEVWPLLSRKQQFTNWFTKLLLGFLDSDHESTPCTRVLVPSMIGIKERDDHGQAYQEVVCQLRAPHPPKGGVQREANLSRCREAAAFLRWGHSAGPLLHGYTVAVVMCAFCIEINPI